MVNRSNIKQEVTKPGDIKMKKKAAQAQKQGLASQGIAENLQKQSMVRRKRGGIIDGNNLVSSYYE